MIAIDLKLALFIVLLLLIGIIILARYTTQRNRLTNHQPPNEPLQERLVRRQHAFLGHLSHELRTPLSAVIAHTEIIRNPATSEDVRRSSTNIVQSESQRMARLVRDLVELHRLETSNDFLLQPINLVLLTEDVLAQVILLAEEHGVTLTFQLQEAIPLALGHPDRLKQVWLVVLDNAIKYCRSGDTVTVSLSKTSIGVQCEIRDTGPGINATDLPHITERLYRGSQAGDTEGSGLGLALVEEILYHHHTHLVIDSSVKPPTGTTIQWTLHYAPPT